MSIQARGRWVLRGPRCRGGRRNLVAPAGLGAGASSGVTPSLVVVGLQPRPMGSALRVEGARSLFLQKQEP